jgi:hypothetical protein
MAATLAIVSFSCTGPLVGSALAGAATGSFAAPTAVMFGFSLALALPFMLFSAFPGWLNSLPQSGWLAEQCQSCFGTLGNRIRLQVSFERGLGASTWIAPAGIIHCDLGSCGCCALLSTSSVGFCSHMIQRPNESAFSASRWAWFSSHWPPT